MANPKVDGGFLIAVAAAILLWMYLSKPAAGTLQSENGCGCGTGAGAGTGGHTRQPSTNVTTPVNPSTGAGTVKLSTSGKGPSRSDLSGAPAPGSNATAPGSGAQWQGLRQKNVTALTPNAAPTSPSSPVGSNVWVAHTAPTAVQG